MNSDEQDYNINLGLDRNTSSSERERYLDHQRAQSWGNSSGGGWSPPGGLGILWGLVRSASKSRPKAQPRPRAASGNGQFLAVLGGVAGAVIASRMGQSWLVGALIGAVAGAMARQLFAIAKWAVIAGLIGLFIAAYNNRPQEKSEAQLYQDAADRFVEQYNASEGLPPADQTYDTIDAIPAAPVGWTRVITGEVVQHSDGTTSTVYRPVYVKE